MVSKVKVLSLRATITISTAIISKRASTPDFVIYVDLSLHSVPIVLNDTVR